MPIKAKETIQRIQHELARKGFDPGLVDGVWGRRTEQAVRAFQAAEGLLADGIVGPKTWAALIGTKASPEGLGSPAMPWFEEARRLIGVKELEGHKNNGVILNWATGAGIPYKSDDIPWCGLFVAHCISSTLSAEPLPINPLGARNWRRFGAPCTPCLGSVLVFWRVSRNGAKGHVGFYAGQEGNSVFHVLGGNQSDSVSISRIAAERLLEARWPSTAPMLGKKLELAEGTSILSTDEA